MKIYVNSQVGHVFLVERSKAKKGQYVNVSLLLDSGKHFVKSFYATGDDKIFTAGDYMPLDEFMKAAYGCKKANRVVWNIAGKVTINKIVYGTMVRLLDGQVQLTTRKDWRQGQSTYTFENFNLFLRDMSTFDIEQAAYNAGW